MDFARTCDLSFGMRIHGTMLPLQSGVPSVLVAHDSRTIGLADKMGIPWVSPEDFVSVVSRRVWKFPSGASGEVSYDAAQAATSRTAGSSG